MKILQFPSVEQNIELKPDVFFHIVWDDPHAFREGLSSLDNQLLTGEDFVSYWLDNEKKDLSKDAFLVENPLKIEFDQKKTDALVQKDIQKSMAQERKDEYAELIQKINEYIEKISFDYAIPLTFDADISLATFLKAVSLTSEADYDTYFDYLVATTKKISFILGYRIFFFVNLHDYLRPDELQNFVSTMRQLEIDLVLLSSHRPTTLLSDEFLIEIDSDHVELHIEPKSLKQ
ncbi:MAG: type II-A CRISPR-associated protein Csn2 [Erysipelotrichaceae bacterium]|nr:type II-A CRISPR-associated protein Csn2 [Erysipelotrichaceae bacterium]